MGRAFVCERLLSHGFFLVQIESSDRQASGQVLPCVGAFGAAAFAPLACKELRGSDEYHSCALRATSTARGSWMPPIFFGQVVAARQSFQSTNTGERLLSKQHLMASKALVPTFYQQHPASPKIMGRTRRSGQRLVLMAAAQ